MLKTATIILIVLMIFAGLYGILLVVSPETVANSTLEARSGRTFELLEDQDAAETILVQTRHLGVFALATTIAVFFILLTGFKKGEQWAWWALVVVGGISWGYGLIMQILEKDMMNLILHLVGIALLLIGVLLPLKAFFPKKG